jgi:hypothetical protein
LKVDSSSSYQDKRYNFILCKEDQEKEVRREKLTKFKVIACIGINFLNRVLMVQQFREEIDNAIT